MTSKQVTSPPWNSRRGAQAKKWFGHCAGRSPCAHSIGKFFLCYIVLFLLETSAPGLSGHYWYGNIVSLDPSANGWRRMSGIDYSMHVPSTKKNPFHTTKIPRIAKPCLFHQHCILLTAIYTYYTPWNSGIIKFKSVNPGGPFFEHFEHGKNGKLIPSLKLTASLHLENWWLEDDPASFWGL